MKLELVTVVTESVRVIEGPGFLMFDSVRKVDSFILVTVDTVVQIPIPGGVILVPASESFIL